MSDEQTMQELIGAINALRESVDCLTDEVRAAFGTDEDAIEFAPDFPLSDSEIN